MRVRIVWISSIDKASVGDEKSFNPARRSRNLVPLVGTQTQIYVVVMNINDDLPAPQ